MPHRSADELNHHRGELLKAHDLIASLDDPESYGFILCSIAAKIRKLRRAIDESLEDDR